MTSAVEIKRQLSAMDAVGWSMVGLEADGPGWRRYMRDDEHPRFLRLYRGLRDLLVNEEVAA
ncbi:hypothetical protein LCM4577_11105 [Mesorhizobium sp. LCM 4577]|nr:hypothetical protein LCM4577_11105 [Mesorhizobium sp. LCM 4577]